MENRHVRPGYCSMIAWCEIDWFAVAPEAKHIRGARWEASRLASGCRSLVVPYAPTKRVAIATMGLRGLNSAKARSLCYGDLGTFPLESARKCVHGGGHGRMCGWVSGCACTSSARRNLAEPYESLRGEGEGGVEESVSGSGGCGFLRGIGGY